MTCRSLGDRRPRSSWEPSAAVIAILTVPHVGGEVRSDSVSLGVDDTRAAQTLRHVVRPLDSSRIMQICLRLMIPGFWNWNRLHLRVPIFDCWPFKPPSWFLRFWTGPIGLG